MQIYLIDITKYLSIILRYVLKKCARILGVLPSFALFCVNSLTQNSTDVENMPDLRKFSGYEDRNENPAL